MKLLMRIIIYRYAMHIPYTCTYYFYACQINGIHDKLWINSNGNSILQNMIYFRETWLVIHVIHMYYNIQSSSLSGEFILDPSLNCQADLCKIRKLLEKNYIRRFKDSNIRWILLNCMHVYTLKYSAVINSSDISK